VKATGAISIRPATSSDLAVILDLILQLARYEKLEKDVVATEQSLEALLFGGTPFARVLLAFSGEIPVGFVAYFYSCSTFAARPKLYVEDLFVKPEFRGCGTGSLLLRSCAQDALAKGCVRMEWTVLDWNADAMNFYSRIGATRDSEWVLYSMGRDALERFVSGSQ
jgi:GNAT superfamily N-acetyltransferase